MIDVLFVDAQVILTATALMPSVMAVMNLATLHRTAPTRFLPQEHHITKTVLIQDIDTPTTKGTDHTLIIVPDKGDISADHSPATVSTMREATVLDGTPHAPLPATIAAHAALWPMDAPITTCAMTLAGIVTPHPAPTTSPADITDQKDTLRLMQRMDPFCKQISKRLLSGKAPSHEFGTFTHTSGLLYKHVIDSNQIFLALVIHKSWCFMVLFEAHNKLGHQGLNRINHLVNCQYYWKGINKDICK